MVDQTKISKKKYWRVFDYLCKWDRDALVERVIESMSEEEFAALNEAALKH